MSVGVLERPATGSAGNRPPAVSRPAGPCSAGPGASSDASGANSCSSCSSSSSPWPPSWWAPPSPPTPRHRPTPDTARPATWPPSPAPGEAVPRSLQSVAAQIAALEHRFGTVQVIENETFNVPGSTQTYDLRSQDPHGPYGGPMLQLLSGRYPTGPDEIALTPGLASDLNLGVGDSGRPQATKTVVGIVQNPQSLLDEFALVAAGPGDAPDRDRCPLRCAGRGPGPHRVQRLDAGLAQQQPDQSRHHRAGAGDRRHAADRTGVGRRLHGAGAAPAARHRDARIHGGDGPQRPARAARPTASSSAPWAPWWDSGWVWWPGSPTARTTSRARTTSSRCSPCRGR